MSSLAERTAFTIVPGCVPKRAIANKTLTPRLEALLYFGTSNPIGDQQNLWARVNLVTKDGADADACPAIDDWWARGKLKPLWSCNQSLEAAEFEFADIQITRRGKYRFHLSLYRDEMAGLVSYYKPNTETC